MFHSKMFSTCTLCNPFHIYDCCVIRKSIDKITSSEAQPDKLIKVCLLRNLHIRCMYFKSDISLNPLEKASKYGPREVDPCGEPMA